MDTYETLIELNIATEEEISLVTSINGNSEDTYLDILFVRTKYLGKCPRCYH